VSKLAALTGGRALAELHSLILKEKSNDRLRPTVIGFLDQILTGARQFIVLLIASWLMKKDAFADFAILNASSLFVVLLPTYSIRLPMLVLGTGRFSKERDNYVSAIRWFDIATTIIGGTIVGTYLLLKFDRLQIWTILLFMVMCIGAGVLELNRRACYVSLRPGLALWGSAISVLLAGGGLYVMHVWRDLDLNSALIVQALSMFGSSVICWRGRLLPTLSESLSLRTILHAHRAYAGWELLGGSLLWMSTNGLIVFGSHLFTASQIGAFRLLASLCNLIALPMNVGEMLLTPPASVRFHNEGKAGLAKWLRKVDHQLGPLLIPYLLITVVGCWLFLKVAIVMRYPEARAMFPIFIVYMGITLLGATRNITLRVMVLSRRICQSEIGRAITCFTVYQIAMAFNAPLVLTSALIFGTLVFFLGQWRSTNRELLATEY
jgi:hypothetical protein